MWRDNKNKKKVYIVILGANEKKIGEGGIWKLSEGLYELIRK